MKPIIEHFSKQSYKVLQRTKISEYKNEQKWANENQYALSKWDSYTGAEGKTVNAPVNPRAAGRGDQGYYN